jgi:hypothetical protein
VRSYLTINARITHAWEPPVLLEIECWRLLVDPTFDPAGSRHNFGSGTGSRNTAGPAIDTPLGVSLMRQTAVNRPDVPLPFVRDLQKRQSPGRSRPRAAVNSSGAVKATA